MQTKMLIGGELVAGEGQAENILNPATGATIVTVPLAVNLALAAGGNPTAFALIVALSASNNFMTASNPVISMITGPAGYTGKELWKIGGPLSLVYTAVIVLMVNLMY